MEFTAQQKQALAAVHHWLANGTADKQIFRLFGFAGTGKTTIAKHLVQEIDGRVCFCAFTGKAALVLRSKGCAGASTVHSLIYKFVRADETGPVFVFNEEESDAVGAALIVVDEVSMVGEEMAKDLMRFGVPILVLGDPAQLPPVAGEGFFIDAEPDFMLTDVQRQAEDSAIIQMSLDIREGRGLKLGVYGKQGEGRVIPRLWTPQAELARLAAEADMVLCGRNATRTYLNSSIRKSKGLAGAQADWAPAVQDRLVCLKNNKDKGLLNGGLWTVREVAGDVRDPLVGLTLESNDDPDRGLVLAHVDWRNFNGKESEIKWYEKRASDQFTFGQALTVHKSQGSQWDNVLIFDESAAFRESSMNHLYTAVTRAAKTVTVVI